MAQPQIAYAPDIDTLITEDDTPVDNLPSEKTQRLLTEPLYSSWAGPGPGRLFLAAANIGVFYLARNPAIVPDVFVSLDVEVAQDWWERAHRSYFLWEFGKPPDVVIEIVSNKNGGEDDDKKQTYARMRVTYYVIYDPQLQIMPDVLTIYQWRNGDYDKQTSTQLPMLNLGLTLWEGSYEGKQDTWLRWTDEHGRILPTGKEQAEHERQQAEYERQQAEYERQQAEHERQRANQALQRAEQERQRAEQAILQAAQERQRAEHFRELLRQLGKDPEQL